MNIRMIALSPIRDLIAYSNQQKGIHYEYEV
jgi:hypothetical protein